EGKSSKPGTETTHEHGNTKPDEGQTKDGGNSEKNAKQPSGAGAAGEKTGHSGGYSVVKQPLVMGDDPKAETGDLLPDEKDDDGKKDEKKGGKGGGGTGRHKKSSSDDDDDEFGIVQPEFGF
ncbi:MAG: hypothetical protein MJ025_02630, partial [Victivallaceae bacterium]|nr:hypothetical protein [Victivallaceae bacterium]